MAAETIDDVLEALDRIVAASRDRADRMGYFAALYRKVTREVKRGVAEGYFEDGPRMERLDVVFANRYLEAVETWKRGERPTEPWALAFEACADWRPIVLQHLLLGMNAHINLDLGVAAAEVSPGPAIEGLREDFCRINNVLASLVDPVEQELAQAWAPLAFLDRVVGRVDEHIIDFSMVKARDAAWDLARELALAGDGLRPLRIRQQERWAGVMARLVGRPRGVAKLALMGVRLTERGGVAQLIRALE